MLTRITREKALGEECRTHDIAQIKSNYDFLMKKLEKSRLGSPFTLTHAMKLIIETWHIFNKGYYFDVTQRSLVL